MASMERLGGEGWALTRTFYIRRAFRIAKQHKPKLTRHDRYRILMKAGDLIAAKKNELARLMRTRRAD